MCYTGMMAKLMEDEASEMGPSRDRDMDLIRVRVNIFKYRISRNIDEHYIWRFAQKTLLAGF